MRSVVFAVGMLVLGTGCQQIEAMLAPAPPEPYPVLLIVERDPGVPIAGASVLYKGKSIKDTDANGAAFLQLQKPDGEQVELNITCPPDTTPAEPLRIKVLRVQGQKYLEQRVRCAPLIRHIAVSVRVDDGPGLPVSYLGEVKATTDASGAAHFLMDVPPNQPIKLRIDASAFPKLKPQYDEVAFQVADADDMFSVQSKFIPEAKKVIRARPKRSGPIAL